MGSHKIFKNLVKCRQQDFLKISSNGNLARFTKLMTAPSYIIIFNFSFPFSIETIEKATAAHRASKLAPAALEVSPRPESSASGSMDSAELRIKEEIEDEDLDDDFDQDDSYSDDEESVISPPKKRGGARKITPINMESQEKIKLERKRQRNRLAASKCRKRKLERISQLELKVKDLKGENSELYNVVKKLKQSVANLKQEVIDHCNSGCQINGDVLNFSTS